MEIWCVGVCRSKGRHEYKVFDEYRDAEAYAARICLQDGVKVFLWQL